MSRSTIHTIHSILSGAFEAAQRWEWVDFSPAESARLPTVIQKKTPATSPAVIVKVIRQARPSGQDALYIWLVALTGVRRGELCAVQVGDIDLENGVLHVAFNYVVKGGKKVRKDTKTHQDRYLAIDPVTCTLIREHLAAAGAALAGTGVKLTQDAYLFSNQPANTGRGTRTGQPIASRTWPARPELSSTSRRCGTTPPASSSPPGSTWATPPSGSATPAAARPP
jgi:integrase